MQIITESISLPAPADRCSPQGTWRERSSRSARPNLPPVRAFLKSLDTTLAEIPSRCGPGTSVRELTISVEINVSGGIELIGKVGASASGGLTFKLVRDDSVDTND